MHYLQKFIFIDLHTQFLNFVSFLSKLNILCVRVFETLQSWLYADLSRISLGAVSPAKSRHQRYLKTKHQTEGGSAVSAAACLRQVRSSSSAELSCSLTRASVQNSEQHVLFTRLEWDPTFKMLVFVKEKKNTDLTKKNFCVKVMMKLSSCTTVLMIIFKKKKTSVNVCACVFQFSPQYLIKHQMHLNKTFRK